jgi:hypothetical protein
MNIAKTATETAAQTKSLSSKFVGMIVSARAASDNRPVYGRVSDVFEAIDHAPNFVRFLAHVENRGKYVPCNVETLTIEGNS